MLDFVNRPNKSVESLDRLYPNDILLVIEDIASSKEVYRLVLQDFIDMMKYGYEHAEVRKRNINIKFKKKDRERIQLQLNHLLSNLIFWKPLLDINKAHLLDKTWLFDFSKFNADTLQIYVNDKLLPVYNTDFASQNIMVDELYHNIVSISHAFCLLMGMSVSLYDLYQLEERNPIVKSTMRDSVDTSLTPKEIESVLADRTKQMIAELIGDEVGNDYKPFFASGTALKATQFKEFIVRIGFKADINGTTVPIFIDNNFLLHGLSKPSYYYLNAISGRKALMLSKLAMGKPGAFSKKLVYQSITSVLSQDTEICDSILTTDYYIADELMLKLLTGRYYYDKSGNMQLLDHTVDTHLIGKIVAFRGPMTCSKPGVCKYCYGHLFDINSGMASAGGLAALKVSEPIGQAVLSTKHDQTTKSNELQFSEGYDEVFETVSSTVTLKSESDFDAELYIKLPNVFVEEVDDCEFYYVTSFELVDSLGKVMRVIEETSGAHFYLNDRLLAMYKQKLRSRNPEIIIPLDDIDDDDILFTLEVKNKELTEPLKLLTKVLNAPDGSRASSINQFAQLFAETLIKLNIKYELVHGEMIGRSLLRKKSNILEYPNFSISGNLNDYQILKLDDAQIYHPSALVSLPYGYLRRQLLSAELYQKTAPGPLDPLYVSKLSDFLPEDLVELT